MYIYNWYHSITASTPLYTRDETGCMYTIIPLLPLLPLFNPAPLTWNPPCCDRIRPPRSRVARKLTPHFPHLAHVALTRNPNPQGFSRPNRHSLGRHCEPNLQSSRTHSLVLKEFKFVGISRLSLLVNEIKACDCFYFKQCATTE